MQQAMIAEGVHSPSIFGSGVSVDMARFVPEALVGRLSGIKIYFQDDSLKGRTLKLKYVSFASVPRLLLYHLTKLLEPEGIAGPAVLLASATSFLEESKLPYTSKAALRPQTGKRGGRVAPERVPLRAGPRSSRSATQYPAQRRL